MKTLEVPFSKEISKNYQNKKVQDLSKKLAKAEAKAKRLEKEKISNYFFIGLGSILVLYVGLITLQLTVK